jgi:hypothetical protein
MDAAYEQGKQDALEMAAQETEGSDSDGIHEWIDGERQAISETNADPQWTHGYLAGLDEYEQLSRSEAKADAA